MDVKGQLGSRIEGLESELSRQTALKQVLALVLCLNRAGIVIHWIYYTHVPSTSRSLQPCSRAQVCLSLGSLKVCVCVRKVCMGACEVRVRDDAFVHRIW